MSALVLLQHSLDVVLAAEPAKESLKDVIVGFFHDGGPFLYINIFWLAAAAAVAVERTITLFFRYNLNAGPFMEQITKLVMAFALALALALSSSTMGVIRARWICLDGGSGFSTCSGSRRASYR